jgi:isopentenyl phosphate kinase
VSSSRSTSPASFIRARRTEFYKVNLEINPHIVDVISSSDLIPVIAPVGISRDGETLNINADTFASALAARTKAKRLLLLTDVAGVLDKDKKLIEQLSIEEARALIRDGAITEGMIPKVEGCSPPGPRPCIRPWPGHRRCMARNIWSALPIPCRRDAPA